VPDSCAVRASGRAIMSAARFIARPRMRGETSPEGWLKKPGAPARSPARTKRQSTFRFNIERENDGARACPDHEIRNAAASPFTSTAVSFVSG